MILPTTLTILLFSMMLVPTGFAKAGVKKGDWVEYSEFSPYLWEFEWDPPKYWPENNTEWIKMDVQSVADDNVEVKLTIHLENGTEKTKTDSGDITAGSGNLSLFIIEANLGVNDTIPWTTKEVTRTSEERKKPSINGTVSRSYAGTNREVNYVNTTYTVQAFGVTLEAYWDKATGILCEMSLSLTWEVFIPRNASLSLKMTDTNMFAPPPIWTEWWFWTIIAVIVIAAAVSGILIWRRRKGT